MECKKCCQCEEGVHEELLIVCDRCDRGFHTFCLGLPPAVPEGSWLCPDCVNEKYGIQPAPESTTSAAAENANTNASGTPSKKRSRSARSAAATATTTASASAASEGTAPPAQAAGATAAATDLEDTGFDNEPVYQF